MQTIDIDSKKSRDFAAFFCYFFLKKILPIWLKCTKIIAEVVKSGVKWSEMGRMWFPMERTDNRRKGCSLVSTVIQSMQKVV